MQKVPRLISLFTPENYNLSLDIDRKNRSFGGIVTISGAVTNDTMSISLHSKQLTIESVTVDGSMAEFSHGDFDALNITHKNITPGKHIIVVAFNGTITDAMHGMYPCYFTHNGEKKELIATQFESHHAREVFPCIDEPEAKATFDVTLTTEPDITVLSNQNSLSQNEQDGRLVTKFATTPRMSTYLLAWVYGDLQKKTASTKTGVEVNVYATPAQSLDSLDFALDHAVKSIDFFDEYFNTPYPLAKSDHVALPDFSSGAMENWGLITYRESALLADPKTTTIAAKQYIAEVISHELAHQWFGNLVTMKWWNNLWLNESFATLMSYIAVDAIHPEWNSWLDFATHESIMALRRDAIDGVQAVQVDVNHPDEISSLFDGAIVYAKGARLMRMCQTYIGNTAFQKGLQTYFAEFAYKNTEADDLWKHLSSASGKDITHFMNTWISQSGYPVVSVEPNALSQQQFFIGPHQDSTQLWPIPLNPESTEDVPGLLDTAQLAMPIADEERLNVGDSAHFITKYNPKHLQRLLARTDLDDISRLQLLHEQTLLIRGGHVSSDTLIDLLLDYKDESSQHVWDIMAVAFSELKKFVELDEAAEQKLRQFAETLASSQFERLGWQPNSAEPESDTKLRAIILSMMIYSQDAAVLKKADELFAGGISSIDPEILPLVLSSVAYRATDINIIKKLLNDYKATQSADLQQHICDGITSVRQPEHVDFLLKNLTDTSVIRPQDNVRWFIYLIRNRYAREATWQWMQNNWQWIEDQFASDKSYDYYPRYAATGIFNQTMRDDYVKFFAPMRNQSALTRVIDLGILEIDARLELLARDTAGVVAKLHAITD